MAALTKAAVSLISYKELILLILSYLLNKLIVINPIIKAIVLSSYSISLRLGLRLGFRLLKLFKGLRSKVYLSYLD
jgi:hypothetical protein